MKPWPVLLLIAALLPGCTTPAPPLPTVEWDTLEDARQILIDRQAAIESVQAQLKLKLTSPPPENETNTLDAALVIQGDDHFRLRAWKLNQTIFDLTATPDGTFIVANEEMKKRAPNAEQDLGQLADQLGAMLRGPDYAKASFGGGVRSEVYGAITEPITHPSGFHELFVEWGEAYTQIESETLVPHCFAVRADSGQSQIVIKPSYQKFGQLYWYRQVTATGDFGNVEMTFRDVELNGELNPRAFKPPRRAVRIDEPKPTGNASP